MAELHWFPLYVADWLGSTAITAMLPEQESGYLRLLIHAWGDGSVEPSLPHDDVKLAMWSRLGSRWRKLGPQIKDEFEERGDRLYNPRLSDIWQEQQKKHAGAVTKAKAAVAAREEKRKRRLAEIDAQRQPPDDLQDDLGDHLQDDHGDQPADHPRVKQSDSDGVVEPTPGGVGVLPSPAPRRALALEGARASGASVAESVADAEARRLEGEFYRELQAKYDEWAFGHAVEAADIKATVLRENGVPIEKRSKAYADLPMHYREMVLERTRQVNGWPNSEQWIAERSSSRSVA